jgi:hypothetical protein
VSLYDHTFKWGPELQVRLVLGQGSTAKQGATTAQEGDRPRPAFLLAKAATVASLHGAPLGRNLRLERYCHHNGARYRVGSRCGEFCYVVLGSEDIDRK